MKISAQIQAAIKNMDDQVDLARKAATDLQDVQKEVSKKARAPMAEGALGKNINTEA